MFDIGWTEMLVVGIVAIIFVGPKELPGMLRTFGRVTKKVRSLAGEFQGQFNEALKEAELEGLKDTVNDVRSLDPTKAIKDKLNPLKQELEKPVEEKKEQTSSELLAEIKDKYAKAQENAKAASSGPNAVPGFSSGDKTAESAGTLNGGKVEKAASERVKATTVPAKKAAPKAKAPKKAKSKAAGKDATA